MSERIIICSSAQPAAEFCVAEHALAKGSSRSRGKKHGGNNSRVNGRGGIQKVGQRQGGAPVSRNIPKFLDHVLVGDSILYRTAKAAGVDVPRNNLTCYGGATTVSMLKNIAKMKNMPKKAIMLIGTNDLMNGTSKEAVLTGIVDLVKALQQKGVEQLLLLTLPPTCLNQENQRDWSLVNEVLPTQQCEGTTVLPIHQLFLKADGSPEVRLFERFYHNGKPDLVHPNKEGLLKIIAMISASVSTSTTSAVMETS